MPPGARDFVQSVPEHNMGTKARDSSLTSAIDHEIDVPLQDKEAVGRIEFEARLIGQEHRLAHLLLNWWKAKDLSKGDPRRAASRRAIVWRFFSPSTAAVGGGIFVVLFALGQYLEIREQNRLLRKEGEHAFATTVREQRKDLIRTLFGSEADSRTRSEALNSFLDMEGQDADLRGANLKGTRLEKRDLQKVALSGADLRESIWEDVDLRLDQVQEVRMSNTLIVLRNQQELRDHPHDGVFSIIGLGEEIPRADLRIFKRWFEIDRFLGGKLLARPLVISIGHPLDESANSGTIGVTQDPPNVVFHGGHEFQNRGDAIEEVRGWAGNGTLNALIFPVRSEAEAKWLVVFPVPSP